MQSGAANAPTEAPLLKSAVANARSFFGKYNAVTLMAAGKLPASPNARSARQPRKSHTLTEAKAKAKALPLSMGWEMAFVIIGALGFVWMGFWLRCYSAPEDSRHVNAAELAYIRQDEAGESSLEVEAVSSSPNRNRHAYRPQATI